MPTLSFSAASPNPLKHARAQPLFANHTIVDPAPHTSITHGDRHHMPLCAEPSRIAPCDHTVPTTPTPGNVDLATPVQTSAPSPHSTTSSISPNTLPLPACHSIFPAVSPDPLADRVTQGPSLHHISTATVLNPFTSTITSYCMRPCQEPPNTMPSRDNPPTGTLRNTLVCLAFVGATIGSTPSQRPAESSAQGQDSKDSHDKPVCSRSSRGSALTNKGKEEPTPPPPPPPPPERSNPCRTPLGYPQWPRRLNQRPIYISLTIALPIQNGAGLALETKYNMEHWVTANPNGLNIQGQLRAVRLDQWLCYKHFNRFINLLRQHRSIYLVDENNKRATNQNPDGPAIRLITVKGRYDLTDSAALYRYTTDNATPETDVYIIPEYCSETNHGVDVLNRRFFNTLQCYQNPGPRGRGAFCVMDVDILLRAGFRFDMSTQHTTYAQSLLNQLSLDSEDTMWVEPEFLEFDWCE